MTPADLAELLRTTAAAVLAAHDLDAAARPATVTVERPRNPEHGDYATNLALQLAKKVGVNPRELAGWLAEALNAADGIASAEVAGPGFVNLRIEASAQGVIVNNVIDAGQKYGDSTALQGQKINLEFVSANPTGPIHIGGTRWAAVGDALGRLLATQGAEVTREYYFNDHGAQIDRFARSLVAAAKGEPTPEDGYAGSYISDIAAQILLPFVLGQLSRRWTADFVMAHPKLKLFDQASIVLVVYRAFGQGVREGLWQRTGLSDIAMICVAIAVILPLMLWLTWMVAGWLGFNRRDQIAIQFCGTKKSLATGVPMASVMFPAAQVGMIVLPLMIFHQAQLMVCSSLASRYARTPEEWLDETNR